ncbi:MAG: DUF523 and DUF1722 domain-containing protein [Chloroflexi bacterium]|nr:DUF523 and DUF1722 domain-containing protein [Chloroflexota bacterium]
MDDDSQTPLDPIRIGISSCLLGEEVRFDGGHKQDRYLTGTLSQYFEWVPVCPEVEVGLGTPRETIRLVQIGDETRLRTAKTDLDLTDRMEKFSKKRVVALAKDNLSGYIFKKDSPSCGMERVKVYRPNAPGRRVGTGVFANAFLDRFPNLPVEEEGRLCDPRLRENWVERVFAYHALQQLWETRWRVKNLIDFHTRHKFVLQSHDEAKYRELGRLVANAKSTPRNELREQYEMIFMAALKRVATVRKNVNVLQHMLGFFSKELEEASRHELVTHIDDYRRGLIPLVVPMTLIRHYVRLLEVEYLQDQVYLNPHPKELALRNHV